MMARGLVLLLGLALGCQSTGGSEGSRGDFGAESKGKRSTPVSAEKPGPGGLRTVYFDFNVSALREDAREILRANARLLQEKRKLKIEIQGHADERGSNEYNLALGKRRAEAVWQYMNDLGIDPKRMSAVSYGEEVPAVSGHSERVWSKNRRGVFARR